ncbi:uroporphyrinogen-III synthase [Arthrobacter pigmenti]|uniref:Uroporphyrinogen-III synthase n=1 Tax=Arthrobacter pigmenti TaxID=271432 RepID=A0A846RS47_9MICC|nr:uroporphyrinogen-III synthase [Arthrobacter pigmenti]NJC22987.1 uroporphyrinogen-III synthase [Arthrobacter pigmenti]
MTADTGRAALDGVRVALLRTPERGAAMAEELERRGADTVLVPLIAWEFPEDTTELDRFLRAASTYDWVVLTSVTTVRVLHRRALVLGTELSELLRGVRVACVGSATRTALRELGVLAAVVPAVDQSASGLLEALPAHPARALLPQSDLAAATLGEGLERRGWTVDAVTAYATVDYPAAADRRVPDSGEPGESGKPRTELAGEELVREIAAGTIDVVVVTSPSTAERLHAIMGELPVGLVTVAIGQRTANDAAAIGLRIDAVAATPGPAGIADAVSAAVANQPRKG